MAANFFYLISSLPTLSLDGAVPFTLEEFLAQCDDFLSENEQATLRKLTLAPDGVSCRNEVAMKWFSFETFLRNRLALLRSGKLHLGAPECLRETDFEEVALEKKVDEAFAMASPVAREYALDSLRMDYLDELDSACYFDFGSLLVYALRLMLLVRRNSRRLDTGKAAFDALLQAGFEEAKSVRNGEE